MIRLAWRQFRVQALVAVDALAAVAITAAVTRPHLVHLRAALVTLCRTADCSNATASFLDTDHVVLGWIGVLVVAVPGLIGLFWGAPLVARELETGTFRLAWTQSVTRTRWLAVKLAVLGLAGAAVAGAFSWILTWWIHPIDQVEAARFAGFDQRDLVAVGYAVFAFALGVLAGALLRRTLPALAATLVVFVTVRLLTVHLLRPRLFAPSHLTHALDPQTTGFGSTSPTGPFTLFPDPPHLPNAWVMSTRIVDGVGREITAAQVARACPQLGSGLQRPAAGSGPQRVGPAPDDARRALQTCVVKLSARFHELVTYQPASRYWAFQWTETALFVAAGIVLAGCCIWLVRRRVP